MAFENLRALYLRLPETLFWLAGRAVQIVDWDRTHQFCGRCGSPTQNQIHDRSKACPVCGLTNYPRLAPAVIVRVERRDEGGRRILLARAQRFPTAMFSVLAGFVEPVSYTHLQPPCRRYPPRRQRQPPGQRDDSLRGQSARRPGVGSGGQGAGPVRRALQRELRRLSLIHI